MLRLIPGNLAIEAKGPPSAQLLSTPPASFRSSRMRIWSTTRANTRACWVRCSKAKPTLFMARGSWPPGNDACSTSGIRWPTRFLPACGWQHRVGLESDLDMETCYKAFRTSLLQSIPIRSDRFGLEPELTIKLAKRHVRVYETPIDYHGRTYDEGKKIGLKDAFNAVYVILRYALTRDLYKGSGPDILDALAEARRFNQWLADTIQPYIGRRVLETGAGIGNLSRTSCRRSASATSQEISKPNTWRGCAPAFNIVRKVEVRRCDLENPADFENAGRDGGFGGVSECARAREGRYGRTAQHLRGAGTRRAGHRAGASRPANFRIARCSTGPFPPLYPRGIAAKDGTVGFPRGAHSEFQPHFMASVVRDRTHLEEQDAQPLPVAHLRPDGVAVAAYRREIAVAARLHHRDCGKVSRSNPLYWTTKS